MKDKKCIIFAMTDFGSIIWSEGECTYELNGTDTIHGYKETLSAVERGENLIVTTQLSLLSTSLFDNYDIFIIDEDEDGYDMFEIKLGGDNERNRREIKRGHNLLKLLLNGEFNKR